MAGHVNMMDDYLISNLPVTALRSALRLLISQGAVTQQPFVEHVRARFLEDPLHFEAPERLFASDDIVTEACFSYLAQTRCIFSCKLPRESLPYLEHFLKAIPLSKVRWTENSELAQVLAKFDGDVVQAVQALKEARPEPSPELRDSLDNLLASLRSCREYCEGAQPSLPFPFTRSWRQVRDVMAIIFPNSAPVADTENQVMVTIPTSTTERHAIETVRLGPFEVPRLFIGLWQLSSPSWGAGTAQNQEVALVHAVERGLTAADMADHYGDAELIYGEFRSRLPPEIRDTMYAATKWCVFSPVSKPITTSYVLDAVRERCRRLGGRVELLQFHWYDYDAKEYLDILVELIGITKSHPELVSTIGLCNFDTEHLEESCEYLIAKTGSFSLVDARPLRKMTHACEKYGVKLLTYGSFYFDMIRTWGTWNEFQTLLECLSKIAHKHNASIPNIATRWVLQQPAVGAVIVGTRLGVSDRVDDNMKVFGFELDESDLSSIDSIALGAEREKMVSLFERLGDCGNEYRKMH
ncbi:aldo/keto reductase [Hypomontagnella submonticulosa]|nr:aldo/keto reductase [Hypomontagnella submonticulosa]